MLTITDAKQHIIEEKLKNLTELYLVVKELILHFEEVNPEQKSDIQPINELRNAFDHLMRVSATALEIRPQTDSHNYILTHIDKAFGHVYRAGYDTVDFLALTIKSVISEDLEGFSVDAISRTLPEYYSTIKPDIERINEDIAEHRAQKDVAQSDAEHLINYIETVSTLLTYRNQISRALPSIAEIDKKNLKEKSNTERRDWFKRIVIGILLLITGYLIHPFITSLEKPPNKPEKPSQTQQLSNQPKTTPAK